MDIASFEPVALHIVTRESKREEGGIIRKGGGTRKKFPDEGGNSPQNLASQTNETTGDNRAGLGRSSTASELDKEADGRFAAVEVVQSASLQACVG